ncbi:MAG TPA: glycoside hydrolase family 78 protein [Terriglobia bacterium]|nr:glycoside hydrolase family 78 protein [Terriglobia bacterium]
MPLIRRISQIAAIVTTAFGLMVTCSSGKTDPNVDQLRCEYRVNPLGVDVPAPRLSWIMSPPEGGLRGARQTAYHVLVASSPAILLEDRGDLWDTGQVLSDQSAQLPYAGKPLRSSQGVYWKIRIWDQQGRPSPWSRPANWTMGILNDSDWRANWITARKAVEESPPFAAIHTLDSTSTLKMNANPPTFPTMMLRHEFHAKAGLDRAVVHICGLGQYELTVNGRRVGEDLLTPGWTKYDKTILYDTYDVTPLLRVGNNAIGVLLGNGMYNVRGGRYTKFRGSFGEIKAIGQLRLEYADGTVDLIGTDGQWRVHPGPITFSCVYGGEDFDARLEPIGWNEPGFDDSNWEKCVEVRSPGGRLKGLSAAAPPVRAFEILKPVHIQSLRVGVSVYDLGQNASLMPRIKVNGPSGAVVRIIPAELIHEDGSVDRGSSGGGQAYWQYTLAGKGEEEWFPKFFYHGCRYLQVECSAPDGKDLPIVKSLEGVVVHSSSEAVGDFSCSNDLFNRIHRLVRWAQRSNMMHVLTDCPHRERLGWLEQYHLNGPSLRYEFDLAALFTKGMSDMADSQLDNGLVPDIAPEYVAFEKGFRDSPEWGSAFLLCAWQQYEWTGDLELLRTHYMAMKRYVSHLKSRSKDYLLSHGLGDWYDLGPKPPGEAQLTPVALTATAFYYEDAATLAKIARLIGQDNDAGEFEELARRIRAAFNKRFFNPANSQYAQGSQCANAISLVMGLVEPDYRSAVLDSVVEDVRHRGNALTAGDVGYRYLLRALADGGRSDVIYAMNNQSENPGYGYQLKQGATSLTEAWDAGRASSQNHFMLGHILEWFYHDLGGIGPDPAVPAFKRIIIRPATSGDLKWVKASYNSINGRIESNWALESGKFKLEVVVPPNTTAIVYVPTRAALQVTEGGRPAAEASGVRYLRMEKGSVVYEVASGRYEFLSE